MVSKKELLNYEIKKIEDLTESVLTRKFTYFFNRVEFEYYLPNKTFYWWVEDIQNQIFNARYKEIITIKGKTKRWNLRSKIMVGIFLIGLFLLLIQVINILGVKTP